MKQYPLIDIHAHVFPDAVAPKAVKHLEGYYHLTWECSGTLSDLKARLDASNVQACVVLSTPTKPSQVRSVNDFLAGLMDKRLIGFGSVHPEYEDRLAEVDRIKRMGLRGFKFHPEFQNFPMDSENMLSVYKRIGTEYPILIHAGDETSDLSSPKRMARLLELFPNHTFIAAHLGGYARWDEATEHLVGKRLYLDTCSTLCRLEPSEAAKLIRAHGVERVLFGTDYPAVSYQTELERFFSMGLTEQENRQILYENAAKLLHL